MKIDGESSLIYKMVSRVRIEISMYLTLDENRRQAKCRSEFFENQKTF